MHVCTCTCNAVSREWIATRFGGVMFVSSPVLGDTRRLRPARAGQCDSRKRAAAGAAVPPPPAPIPASAGHCRGTHHRHAQQLHRPRRERPVRRAVVALALGARVERDEGSTRLLWGAWRGVGVMERRRRPSATGPARRTALPAPSRRPPVLPRPPFPTTAPMLYALPLLRTAKARHAQAVNPPIPPPSLPPPVPLASCPQTGWYRRSRPAA